MSQKQVLGKGLASLFPGMAPAEAVPPAPPAAGATAAGAAVLPAPNNVMNNKDRHPGIAIIGTEEIKANPRQPRRDFDQNSLEELAQSIRANGVIQPLIVR